MPSAVFGRLFLRILAAFAFFLSTLEPCSAGSEPLAKGWSARLCDEGLPERLVAVDKKNKFFHYLEKKSPLRLRYSYPCVTGQLEGDKQQINDLKTPEGVYFVEYKIANGLDFGEYGGIAYTLNYPNPVDRLRGKTGHGIWIHSKGHGLVPTRGCVAIGLKDIAEVGPNLRPGTPVLLTREFDAAGKPSRDTRTARQLRRLMQDWSEAWAERSLRLFDFYDPSAYSLATENFDLFRQNKERLFRILSFIKIFNREIHALEGPGYWVTWAEQFYTASNLSTEGVRRLYWQPGPDGKYRIVGMEWTPRDMGMAAEFRQGRLVAQAPLKITSDASSEAPRQPPLEMPELSAQKSALPLNASPPVPASLLASASPMPSIPKTNSLPPAAGAPIADAGLVAEKTEIFLSQPMPDGRPAQFNWHTGQPVPEQENDSPPKIESAADSKLSEKVNVQTNADMADAVRNAALKWNSSLAEKNSDIFSLYDEARYNRMPGVQRGPSLRRSRDELNRLLSSQWLTVISREPRISSKGGIYESVSDQLLASPAGITQGQRILRWADNGDGLPRIVAADFRPGDHGLGVDYLEQISLGVSRDIEAWRKSWEKADIDGYMAFYADNAQQAPRFGHKNIRLQKAGLWGRIKPEKIRLSGIRLALAGRQIRADMTQDYADSAGRSDRGVKSLLMRYDGQRWLIEREDWSPLPATSRKPAGADAL